MSKRPVRDAMGIVIAVCVGIAGYSIHHSVGWAIVDALFWPIAVCKWLICHQLTLAVLKDAFGWFFS